MIKLQKIGAVLGVATLLLAGCGQESQVNTDPSASAYGTIRISTGISEETAIIAAIYGKALEEVGYRVELVDTGSDRAGYLTAMEGETRDSGGSASPSSAITNNPDTVDLVADYSGNLLLYLTQDGTLSPTHIEQQRQAMASSSPSASYSYGWGDNRQAAGEEAADEARTESTEPSPAQTGQPSPESSTADASASPTGFNINALSSSGITDTIARVLPSSLSLLNVSEAQNRDALVITRATATRYSIQTIDDLAGHCGELTFGGPTSFKTRSYGLPALEQRYGCTPEAFVEENDQGELSDMLASNRVQVADIFSASADIDDNAYRVIEGTDSLFIPQQIVPVMKTEELPSSARDAINGVSARLTSDDLETFSRLASGDGALGRDEIAAFWINQTRG